MSSLQWPAAILDGFSNWRELSFDPGSAQEQAILIGVNARFKKGQKLTEGCYAFSGRLQLGTMMIGSFEVLIGLSWWTDVGAHGPDPKVVPLKID